jgi:anti-sigma factor RsiW
MSTCGRTAVLESIVAGEAPAALAAELRAHATNCARCRHELNWLETEARLFRERAARDEVSELWMGVARRRGMANAWPWSRVLMAFAASVLVLLGASRLVLGQPGSQGGTDASSLVDEVGMSEPLMSPVLSWGERENCSRMPDGVGFRCEPAIAASFLASR